MPIKKKKRTACATPQKARSILDILEKAHPDARIYLNFDTPFQLLIATILSAQCTDDKVNEIAPQLFERFPTAADIAGARPAEIEQIIRPTGFFRQKTRSVQACCRALVEECGGKVPPDMDVLTGMRGIGRKTASVVLANAFGRQAMPVDTHVGRVATRLGLAAGKGPDKIERQLCALIPKERWARASHLLGTHGRRICTARKPDHESCPANHLCDFFQSMPAE